MTLLMPIALASGVCYLDVRVPADIVGKARGSTFVLPVDGRDTLVRATDKVMLSLRTKDPAVAKRRFSEAHQALLAQWQAVREGPKSLLHREIVGIAGEVYRARVDRHQGDPAIDGSLLEREVRGWVGVHQRGAEGLLPTRAVDRPQADRHARDWLAFHLATHGQDAISVSEDLEGHPDAGRAFLEQIYGRELDVLLARRGLAVDPQTRGRLLAEVARGADETARSAIRSMEGDFSPDPVAARFPVLASPKPAVARAVPSHACY